MEVHGLTWVMAYWLLATGLGIVLDVSNLRHAWGQVRSVQAGEPDEQPMRASTLGHLLVHLAVAVFLAIASVVGLGLLVGSLTSGLTLQFANGSSEVFVIGLALVIPTAPTLIAALFWLWRWQTLRALGRP